MKGNLAKDPSWNKNNTVFELRIAVDKAIKFRTEENTYDYEAGFFDIKFFKERAHEVANMNLAKGDLIQVLGDDQIVRYKSSDEPNVTKLTREILGTKINILSKKSVNSDKPVDRTDVRLKKDNPDLDSDVDITLNWSM